VSGPPQPQQRKTVTRTGITTTTAITSTTAFKEAFEEEEKEQDEDFSTISTTSLKPEQPAPLSTVSLKPEQPVDTAIQVSNGLVSVLPHNTGPHCYDSDVDPLTGEARQPGARRISYSGMLPDFE